MYVFRSSDVYVNDDVAIFIKAISCLILRPTVWWFFKNTLAKIKASGAVLGFTSNLRLFIFV